jgi:hypothetical protein
MSERSRAPADRVPGQESVSWGLNHDPHSEGEPADVLNCERSGPQNTLDIIAQRNESGIDWEPGECQIPYRMVTAERLGHRF